MKKNITIRLNNDDHEFLRSYCFENRKSINQTIVELVQELKKENKKEDSAPPTK